MSVPPISGGPEWDTGETLAQRFRAHARDSEDLYGYATRVMADDWEVGGPTRLVCGGSDNAPRGAVIHLRLLAGVFRLVLTGRAPELVPYYPCPGGTAPASQAWPVMREVIAANIDEIHAALAIPPQTNEVGRSAAMLAGLCDLVAASGVRRIPVLWHSIIQMYWLPEEVAAVEAIMRTAGAAQLLGKVGLEFKLDFDSNGAQPELRTRLWSFDAHPPRERCLAQRTITSSRSDSQAVHANWVRSAQRMTWHQLLALGISSNWCQVTPTDAK
jgi:hypothetical protein